MADYEVIKFFRDMLDNDHPYSVGDSFPRHGKEVSAKRIEELSTVKNRRHTPLIRKVGNGSKQEFEAPEVVEVVEETVETPTEETAEVVETVETTVYGKAELEEMKLAEIRELAKTLGFKISSTSKENAIAEFLEKQN